MSTAPTPVTAPAPAPHAPPERSELKVVSHSNLFYWWPVWAVGFLMALITWIDGDLMTTVPKGSKAVKEVTYDTDKAHEGIVLPPGKESSFERTPM